MSIGIFFVGTSKTLSLENSPTMIILGLMIIGSAAGMISIPVLPEMLEAIEEKKDRNYNMEALNDYISAIFVTSTGLGEFIGPTLSSMLNVKYGFRESMDIYANIVLIFALLYFMSVGHFFIFIRTDRERSLSTPMEQKHVELSEMTDSNAFASKDER